MADHIYKVMVSIKDSVNIKEVEWEIKKETPKNYNIILLDEKDGLEFSSKRLNKDKIGKIDTLYTNKADGVIGYFAWVWKEDIEKYKELIINKIGQRVEMYKNEIDTKLQVLKELKVNN